VALRRGLGIFLEVLERAREDAVREVEAAHGVAVGEAAEQELGLAVGLQRAPGGGAARFRDDADDDHRGEHRHVGEAARATSWFPSS
jgi:hypothetical protein